MKLKSTNLANFSSRFVALFIDLVIVILLFGILTLVIPQQTLNQLYSQLTESSPWSTLPQVTLQTQFGFIKMFLSLNIFHILTNYVYSVFLISTWGQTIGKKLVGIKVVNQQTQKPPNLVKAVIRETLGKFLSGICLGLGFFWMWKNQQKQTWHDLLANTIVIKV